MRMSVHPVEFRYFYPQMKSIFTEENTLRLWLRVEAALAEAHAEVGNIPREVAEEIRRKATTKHVTLKRVKEIEKSTRHDLMAMVLGLTEACQGEAGKYVHLGVTSEDIKDTARSLQLKEALVLIYDDLYRLRDVLVELADRHKGLVAVGRTHGVQASPTTYGIKFAVWAVEIDRHIQRMKECEPRLLIGKIMGSTGTQAALGRRATDIQSKTLGKLGLNEVLVATQILSRDRHAEFTNLIALIASTLEKIGTEVRNLQRTEIGEVEEHFAVGEQIGSSAMPSKRNPIVSERICGLSRVVRAYASVALQNVTTWHERDLTQSAPERVVIPTSCILIDYMLRKMTDVLRNLKLNPDRIKQNLLLTHGLSMSESVLTRLVEKGLGRQAAHEILRKLTNETYEKGTPFDRLLLRDPTVRKYMTEQEIRDALDPSKFIGTSVERVEKVVQTLRRKGD